MDSFRIAAALVGAALALPAFAQNERRIDNREENLEYRIQQGEKAGTITPQEAARLRKQQDHIRDLENKAEADGKVTKEERAQIEAAQDRASRRIAGQNSGDQRSSASTGASRRDNREEKQEYRIEKGEKAGKITEKEAERLRRGQDHVRDVENKAEYDGKVTAKERARIEAAQDVQSKKINRQKQDEQSRAGVGATAK